MPRAFEVPQFFKSPDISAVKRYRQNTDPRKKDLSPTLIDFGPVRFKISRHFGFCFGVENAIEIAYKTVEENPGKRIFLVSEMIHNPEVNEDLLARGVRFLLDTSGKQIFPLEQLTPDDIVIVPAFGATVELQRHLSTLGLDPYGHSTTCPFVEKVWKRASEIGKQDFTIIVHGKRTHEETRATFSHSKETAPTLVIFDMDDAQFVADYIQQKVSTAEFRNRFDNCMSDDFDPEKHIYRVGVINQTTMLATETKAIAALIRQSLVDHFGEANIKEHFADTRDTLCYATYENQSSTLGLIESGMDIAVVVGGYNSSNTSHLVELCQEVVPTYYIRNASEILDINTINHFVLDEKKIITSNNWLPEKNPITIGLTSGASCPDKIVQEVLEKIVTFFPDAKSQEEAFAQFHSAD